MFKPRGFYTSNGYVGFLPDGSRIIFATHNEYAKPFALKRITDSFNE